MMRLESEQGFTSVAYPTITIRLRDSAKITEVEPRAEERSSYLPN